MSIHREEVEKNELFGEFEKLTDFEDVSASEVTQLKAMILDTAEQVGPHLDRIRHTFMQYTEHDLQHLLNIADHIYDFLPRRTVNGGEVIALNAVELTYLWLAILLHDIGMFVSENDEKQRLLDSDAYRDFCRHNRERIEAADHARESGHTVTADSIHDALFAEFIRRQHAERVNDYIKANLDGKLTFRTDLSDAIGNLCESHNWGVRQSRDSRCPENCVAELKTHDLVGKTPVNLAYLACCLRLGDVLDFDRSRTPLSAFHHIHFTESISEEEWNKHLSVKGIEVTEHRAHYVAECEHPADYVAVHQFLNWVDRELQDCLRLVREFPSELAERYQLHLAEVVDRTDIRMKDSRYVAGAFHFQLEYDQIMRLLMDKSLYPDETLFLRELLQNALDACRYQTARAQEADMGDKYVPRIHVWDGSTAPRDPEKPDEGPRIVFQDNGVGMSLDQVENFFMRVGRSFYRSAEFNAERERLEEKGIHLDACSQFGIGFLSCFLGGDRIEVETFQYGSEPLRITIEGPRKYFVIERLPVPTGTVVPFRSPADPADDSPPQCAGTKITVHLRDGWRKATSDPESDLVYQTLDTVAVNQEIPISVTSLDNPAPRELAARRWDQGEPVFPGWNLGGSEPLEAELVPSVFSLHDFVPSLRGIGVIWFLSQSGEPAPRRGDLSIYSNSRRWRASGLLREDRFVCAVRKVSLWCSSLKDSEWDCAIAVLRDVLRNPEACETICNRLWHEDWHDFEDVPDTETFRAITEGDLDWARAVVDTLPNVPRDFTQWPSRSSEVEALLSGDRDRLLTVWRADGIGYDASPDIRSRNRIALFGIELPGAFQTWDAAKGNAKRHNWLPSGSTLTVDTYGSLAPEPAASRLFVPFERSKEVRAETTRAFVLHANSLWKEHQESDDWREWYIAFLNSWQGRELGLALAPGTIRNLSRELEPYMSRSWPIARLTAGFAAQHSRFGSALFHWKDPRSAVTPGQIEQAAKGLSVHPDEVDELVLSLSEHMGWDITQGLDN